MKFAAIADIHGNSAALEAVLADIAALGITEVVNLGDHDSTWRATIRYVPYDHTTMADLAARNGRPDWASAIATGWLR